MLQQLHNTTVFKFLWGFMALYILNCCIDVPSHNLKKENLSINKQESILELIIEKLLGFDNAVAEYDEADNDTGSLKKTIAIDFFIAPPQITELQKQYLPYKKPNLTLENHKALAAFYEIHSPPPEA